MSVFENAVMPVGNTSLFEILARLEEAGLPSADDARELLREYVKDSTNIGTQYKKLIDALLGADNLPEARHKLDDYLQQELLDYLPKQFGPLIEEIDDATEEDGSAAMSWELDRNHLPSTFRFPGMAAGAGVSLEIQFDARAVLGCQAEFSETVPGYSDSYHDDPNLFDTQAVTSFQAAMSLQANAAAQLPINYGHVSLQSGAELGILASWYWLHAEATPWYQAVQSDLQHIPGLFSASELKRVMDNEGTIPSFHGYRCELARGVRFNGELGLGVPTRMLPAEVVRLGLTFGYGIVVKAPVALEVYRYQDNGEQWLNVRFSAVNERQHTTSVALSIEIDVQQQAAAVARQVSEHLKQVGEIIDRLQGEALVKTYITDPAFNALKTMDNSDEWKQIVATLQGDMTGQGLAQTWKNAIDGQINNASDSAQAILMEKVAGELNTRVDGLPAGLIKEKLTAKVPELSRKFSTKVVEKLEQEVGRLLGDIINGGDNSRLHSIASEIAKAGIQINAGAASLASQINNAIAPLKQHLKRYKALLEQLQQPVELASKARIKASQGVRSSAIKSHNRLADISVKVSAMDQYQDQIDQLLAGNITPLVDSGKDDTSNICLHEAVISSQIKRERRHSAELVLVDFKVDGRSLLSSDVKCYTNLVTGEVTVGSLSSAMDAVALFNNSRSILINTAFSHQNARQLSNGVAPATLPSTELAIYRKNTQTKLTKGEFKNTVEVIRGFGLIQASRSEIRKKANQAAFKGKDAIKNADINFSIVFSREQTRKILTEYERDKNKLLQAFANMIEKYKLLTPEDVQFMRENSDEFGAGASSASELFLYFYPKRKPPFDHEDGTFTDMDTYNRIDRLVYRMKGYADAFKHMSKAFDIMLTMQAGQPGANQPEWYDKQAKKLSRELDEWIDLSTLDVLLDWFNTPIKDRSISTRLMLLNAVLADMADVSDAELNVILSLTYQENGETKVLSLV